MSDRGNRVVISVFLLCGLIVVGAAAQPAPTTMWAVKRPGLSTAEVERLGQPQMYFARVVDENDKPVASAQVHALTYVYTTVESGELITTLVTDSDGRFQLSAINSVQALVQAPGFGLTAAYVYRETSAEEPLQIRLKKPSELHVHFVGPDGQPAAGAKIVPDGIGDTSNDGSRFSMSVQQPLGELYAQTTDAAGEVVFPNVGRDSSISFATLDDRYAGRSLSGSREGIKIGALPLTDGGVVKLDAGGSIAGRVTIEETGKPIPDVRVYALAQTDGRIVGNTEAMTDADGNYMLRQLRPGNYDVQIQSDPKRSAMYAAKGIGRVTLESGQKVFGKDFLFVNGAVVQGKVTVAGTGKPVAGAQVSASTVAETPTGPRSSGTAMAGPDGSYMLHVLPGLVQMSAYTSTPGLLSQPTPNKQVNVADGQTETANFEFKPDPTPPVNGKVVGADGKPVADANILVEPPRNQNNSGLILASIRGVNAKSDPDGKFTMLSIPNGTVLRARKGTAGTVKETTISSSNRDVTLTLKDDAAGSVLLRVTQPDGTPLPGAQVTVIQRSAGPNSIGTGVEPGPTKNDGTRLIKSLFPDYTYSYQLTAKGFGRESGTLQFQSGKQIEIPIKLVKADSFVAGMVTDETGLPAADQEVQVSGQKSQPQMIKTDIMGHFRAEAIVPGDTVSVFTVIRTTDASGRTLARAGERQAVPAGTDNVVLVNTPPPPPTTRPGGRRGP